jgi:RNA polymerase sigma-70 factor (ECF subfamily)
MYTKTQDAPLREQQAGQTVSLSTDPSEAGESSEQRAERLEGRKLATAIAAGRAGDPSALQYLYDRYSRDVYGYVCSIVRDEHEAEDIVQNVFIKLMRVLPKYEQRGVPFSAWLFRVARNVALDHMRSRRAIPCEEVHDRDQHGNDGQFERDLCLRDALANLSIEQRRVVLWRHLLGLSPVEIAEALGRTEGSIHALHHRGRRAIQAELRTMQAGPATRAA